MYAELVFSYLIDEDIEEIELPSPLEKPGHDSKYFFNQLEVMLQFFHKLKFIAVIQTGDNFKWKLSKMKKNVPVSGYMYGQVSPKQEMLPLKRPKKPNREVL